MFSLFSFHQTNMLINQSQYSLCIEGALKKKDMKCTTFKWHDQVINFHNMYLKINYSVFMHYKNVGFSVFYTACTCILNYNKMMLKTPTIHFDMHACIWYCGCLSKYTQWNRWLCQWHWLFIFLIADFV